MFVPGLNGSSLGGELPLGPFFFFWFFGVVEEGELLEDGMEGSQPVAVAVAVWTSSLSFGILLGLIGCLLLLLLCWTPHFHVL